MFWRCLLNVIDISHRAQGPDWWSMMDELAIRPGQYFALTLVCRGKFSLTVFNNAGEALMASHIKRLCRQAQTARICFSGCKPQGQKFKFKLCKKSNSVEMFSTTTLRDMVRSGFWHGKWVRFYLSKDTSLEDGVVRFEVS
ncbi:hypothetical protein Tco_0492985 [Tanacetum coccineum]